MFELARLGVSAERLRVKGWMARMLRRAMLAAVCLAFLLAAFVLAQMIALRALEQRLEPILAEAILLAANFLVALVLGWVVTRSRPGAAEREAQALRAAAWREIMASLSAAQMALSIGRHVLSWLRKAAPPQPGSGGAPPAGEKSVP